MHQIHGRGRCCSRATNVYTASEKKEGEEGERERERKDADEEGGPELLEKQQEKRVHARLSPFAQEGARPLQNGVGKRVTVGGGVCGVCAAAGCHGGPARPHPHD